ncbi:MAG: LytTR family transcriptional regulator DNA-binding domain-containing protein [Prevotella sp.]|nr:LytTR family transcriptional regulator DNA-binding domain-containing protein [Bacteroides sp.]MCM1366420.1 LytTR family transcriptional regulator DNA-binding domain-containing protein [Prevotella sp.]
MSNKYLIINSRDEFLRIEFDKIIAFESDGNYTNIIMTNKVKAMVGMNLSQMQQVLVNTLGESAVTFARVGKRHIVNLQYVYRINIPQQKLYLSDNENFVFVTTVSKEALKQLRGVYSGVLG